MPDHHTTIKLLGIDVPVTVSWELTSISEGGELEIEGVFSDVLGEITELVLNDAVGTSFTIWRVEDKGWQDPIQAVLFGQPSAYRQGDSRIRSEAQQLSWGLIGLMQQHEPTKAQIGVDCTLYSLLCDEIYDSVAFGAVLYDAQCDRGWDEC